MPKVLFSTIIEDFHLIPKMRLTQKGKYSPRAKRYYENQNSLAWRFKQSWFYNFRGRKSIDFPIKLEFCIWVKDKRVKDIDNLCGAIMECLKKAGIIKDDNTKIISQVAGQICNDENSKIAIKILKIENQNG